MPGREQAPPQSVEQDILNNQQVFVNAQFMNTRYLPNHNQSYRDGYRAAAAAFEAGQAAEAPTEFIPPVAETPPAPEPQPAYATHSAYTAPEADDFKRSPFYVSPYANATKGKGDYQPSGEDIRQANDIVDAEIVEEDQQPPAPAAHNPAAEAPKTHEAGPEKLDINEAIRLLSYADVSATPGVAPENDQKLQAMMEYTRNSPNGLKYARELQRMVEKHGRGQVFKYANMMRARANKTIDQLGLVPSEYADSQSWALWDMAKQSYLTRHPNKSSDEYRLGDPMEDSNAGYSKRSEIVNRHVGWEIAHAAEQGTFQPEDLEDLPQSDVERMRAIIDVGQRNETGQLRSHFLASLGRQAESGLAAFHNPALRPEAVTPESEKAKVQPSRVRKVFATARRALGRVYREAGIRTHNRIVRTIEKPMLNTEKIKQNPAGPEARRRRILERTVGVVVLAAGYKLAAEADANGFDMYTVADMFNTGNIPTEQLAATAGAILTNEHVQVAGNVIQNPDFQSNAWAANHAMNETRKR